TKPFDARGLLAVVENALQRAAEGRIRHIDSIPIEEDISITDIEERDSGTMPAGEEASKKGTAVDLAQRPADIVVAASLVMPEPRRKDPDDVAATIRKAMTVETLEE